MAVVWQNTFDGPVGNNLTPINSANYGDPILDNQRNGNPADAVRYGNRAYMGNSSMQLGLQDGTGHGDTWVYSPSVNAYSLSFYLYLTQGGWFRFRDANNVSELYFATGSQSVVVNELFNQESELFDRWVRVEFIVSSSELGIRIWWSDPDSTGTPDYEYIVARDGGTVGDLLCQGGAGANVYVDQVQVGEGEWLGPWPAGDRTIAATGTLPVAGGASITADLDPILWENRFDGTHNTPITVTNSATHGDPVSWVTGTVAYTTTWSAAGPASARIGAVDGSTDGGLQVDAPALDNWSMRAYMLIPAGGWHYHSVQVGGSVVLAVIDNDEDSYQILHQDVSAHADQLVDRPIRVEVTKVGDTATARVWWTSPHSTGEHDLQVQVTTQGWGPLTMVDIIGGGYGTPASYVDEVAVGVGEWIGPATPDDVIIAQAVLPLSGGAAIRRGGRTEAEGSLTLSSGARIVRHARMGAAASLGVSAPEVDVRRGGHFDATSTLPVAGRATIRSQFRATFPPRIITELQIDGEWVDISADVLTREPVHITRGRGDEATTADPSTCSLTLNNRRGTYSPHNPLSPYYGKLTKNTPLRVRVGPLPDTPDLEVEDTFDRSVTSGWGTATTGQTWTGDTTGASVSGGAAHHRVDTVGASGMRGQYMNWDSPHDVDITVDVDIDRPPHGWISHAAYAEVMPRRTLAGERIVASVGFRVDTGDPRGLRVSTSAAARRDGMFFHLSPWEALPGLVYRPGEWLSMRVQAVGPEMRLRVWPAGTPEPDVWHTQVHHPDRPTDSGGIGVESSLTDQTEDTDLPLTVSYRNLVVRPIHPTNINAISRFTGVVSEWPPRWDVSDSDVWVPITASGVLRRLGQGSKPLRSVLRRGVEANSPVAYWPLEDGPRTRQATSVTPGVSPLRVAGFQFGEDTSLTTSAPLPTLSSSASMSVQSLAVDPTPSGWEVDMLYRLEAPGDDGYSARQVFLELQNTEFDLTLWLDTEQSTGRPILRREVVNARGDLVAQGYTNISAGAIPFFGAWRRLRVSARPTDVGWVEMRVDWFDVDNWGAGIGFTFSSWLGRITGLTTTFGPELEGMGLGHITVWGALYTNAYLLALPGHDRETARQRMVRLSAGASIPVEVTGAASETLGVEQRGTYLEVIGQAQEADFGAPGESRSHLGLTYRGRDLLYNQDPALTLDYAAGEISPPMEPIDDDQALLNEVEVTRADGASFQVEDITGPLGVDTVGRYDTQVTLNLGTDTQVEHHAGWRLHLGTVDELRWPTIHLNLANPRLSARVEDILSLDVGDRIRVLNPPMWTQAAHLDLIVQGYTETLNLFTWEIEVTCTPASPWQAAQITNGVAPPDAPMRADTAGSELASAVDAEATVLEVTTTRGPTWVTDPTNFPFDITVGGEVMRVTTITGTGTTQTFEVERAVNGIHKNHPTTTPVRLADPAVVAL